MRSPSWLLVAPVLLGGSGCLERPPAQGVGSSADAIEPIGEAAVQLFHAYLGVLSRAFHEQGIMGRQTMDEIAPTAGTWVHFSKTEYRGSIDQVSYVGEFETRTGQGEELRAGVETTLGNADYARMDQVLREGDEVAFLPPVSGG